MRAALKFFAAALLAGTSFSAAAQQTTPPDTTGGTKTFGAWIQVGQAPTMSVSTFSSNEAFGTGVRGPVARICNTGGNPAFARLGVDNTVVASATADALVQSGTCVSIAASGFSWIAAIATGGSTTLNISLGVGSAQQTGSGGNATGTAGSPSTSVLSIQGVAGGTAVPTTSTATFNGFDSGPVQVSSPTLNAGSYSAGMSLGGLFTVSIGRINGGSGGLSLIGYKSTAGSTGQVLVRIWQKNPASTTCTDHTAFVSNATDDTQLVIAPFAMTPAAPPVTTGDAATYVTLLPGRVSWVNSDTSPSKNLYVCVLTVATDTADEASTVAVRLSGDLN